MMSNSVLLLTLAIVSAVMLMTNASPVDMMLVQSNGSATVTPTTTPNGTEQHFSLSRYTAMVHRLVATLQTIQTLLAEHVRIRP